MFKFGICPCCSVNTGIYDFYGMACDSPMPAATKNKTEIDTIFIRTQGYRYDYCSPYFGLSSNSGCRIVLINNNYSINSYQAAFNNSSMFHDWYIPYFSGQEVNLINSTNGGGGIDSNGNFIFTISPYNINQEICWAGRVAVDSISNISNPIGNPFSLTGFVTGTGARIEDNKIILTTSGLTSGCYIEYLPSGTGFIYEMSFALPQTFDKWVLLTVENPNHPAFTSNPTGDPSGFYYWMSPTSYTSRFIPITSGATRDYLPNVSINPINPDYVNHNLTFANTFDDVNGNPKTTKIRLTLSDNTGYISGFSINNISGLSCTVPFFYITQVTSGTARGDVFNSRSYQFTNDITLFDCENKRIIKRIPTDTGNFLGNYISGTDMARLVKFSGLRYSENDYLFDNNDTDYFLNNVPNYPFDSPYHVSYIHRTNRVEISTNYLYYFGSGYPYFKYSPTFDGFLSDQLYQSGNVSVPMLGINAEFDSVLISPTGDKIAFCLNIRPYDVPASQDSNPYNGSPILDTYSKIGDLYHTILWYDQSGNKNFDFGEYYGFDEIDYSLPSGEYFNALTGGVPFNINNYNTTTNLPRIAVFAQKDFPNCFSVQIPKRTFSTGLRSGVVNQEVKILYGPYETNTYPIYYENIDSGTYNINGINRVTTSPGNYLYEVNRHMLHGSTTGNVFWSDSYSQMRAGASFITPKVTGLPDSSVRPNLSANILWGDCIDNTPAAIFTHSRHFYSGIEASGSGSIKVKIGNNIVFDKRIYDNCQCNPDSPYCFARGLSSIHHTESSQKVNMSGSGVSYVWFEKLWLEQPTITGSGLQDGWRMHVANLSGYDLWTKDSTGIFAINTFPSVISSSDRFIYVQDFFTPYSGIVSPNFGHAITGGVYQSGDYFDIRASGYWSGGAVSVGFSHDGTAIIPLSYAIKLTTAMTTGVFPNLVGFAVSTGYTRKACNINWYNNAVGTTDRDKYFNSTTDNIGIRPHLGGGETWYLSESLDLDSQSFDSIKNSNLISNVPAKETFICNMSGVIPQTGFTIIASGYVGSGML